jgi:S-layer protein (TIGR01567 family)
MYWRRFMDHVRVGGVCLLLIIIAAALPLNVLAQPSQSTAGSSDLPGGNTAGGATPIISKSLLSESSGPGETISAEKLAKRSSGLKPLTSAGSSAASEAPQTAQEAQTPAAPAPESNTAQAVVSQTTSTGAAANTATEQSTSTESQKESPAQGESPQTANATSVAEAAVIPSTTSQVTEAASMTNVTPPENVTPGTMISENGTASNITTSESISQNESQNVSENASEKIAAESSKELEITTDRIWREGISPYDYTWTPQSFSGFFYDLKNDVGTEKLTVKLQNTSRSIDSGDLTYSTSAQDTDFEFGDWGSYQVIGFMADKYFAGYKANEVFDKDRSLINDGQLRQVLIDSDDSHTITTGSVLPLEEGYELRIKQIDINGNKVYLSLAKNGDEIDSKVISPDNLKSATYQYEVDIAGEKTPIVLAHISNVFASAESALVTVDGLFQISDTYASVEDGDKYDRMKVTSVSDQGVEMDNENSLTLRKGGTVSIFGNVGFQVADADVLRFAPVVQRTGNYEVRGTVINPADTSEFTWTPYNFEGFFYDIDDDVGTESLQAKITGGTRIEEKNLLYMTRPQPVKFQFEDWGKYDVIGFMADKYFAGYNNLTKFTDEASSINEGQLSKILIDSDDSQTIASGSVLSLEEGYELRIKQVDLNGNKVYLALAKDGNEVDSKVVTPSADPTDRASNYMYKVDIGGEKDVPIIIAHIQSVFRSTETDLATVDGLFQVSDSPESVEEGEVHGKMKVESLGDDGITLRNEGSISLGRGRTIEIMENLKMEVADSAKRLIAPIATKSGEGTALTLSIPEAIVDKAVTFTVKSGSEVLSGVQISVNGSNIGTTDVLGMIGYTPKSTGTFDVVAKKSGYNDAKGNLVVRTAAEAAALAAVQQANATMANQLFINSPAEVTRGQKFLISVAEGINQTPVENAGIFFDELSIGNTSAEGTLTYSTNATGEHSLRAEKAGNSSITKTITVTSPVEVLNLTVPDKASVGQDLKISANVQNTGQEADYRILELKVNDTVVDSKNVSLKAGENSTTTFSYKPKDPGLYKFSLDSQSKSVNVEKAQNSNWLIALIIVLLIAIGAGIYLYKTGELENLKKQLQGR